MQRFVDAWIAFPGLLLLLTIMSIAGQGLPQIIVVLGIAGGVGGSRVVRGAVVATKENDYFLAAKAVGAPTTQVLVRHVLPNIVAPLIIVFSINVGGVILAEASLSFLHLGRGSVHQTHLVEVSVLRDQCEPMLFAIFPDRKVISTRKTDRANVLGSGE